MLNTVMSKKTLALIAGLTVLTLALVVLALNTGKKAPQTGTENEQAATTDTTPTMSVPASTIVKLSPDPIVFSSTSASVNVDIDTAENEVTGAQFEIVYDPAVLNFSSIRQGDFFQNALILINDVNRTEGRITYALGLTPAGAQNPESGTGTVATVVFTRRSTAPTTGTSPLKIENVMIAAKGVGPSVLKEASGATVNLSRTASPSGR